MIAPSRTRWCTGLGLAAAIAGLAFAATVTAPTPAAARVFVGVGFGFPGFWYPPPYPYYYYPPPAYYYPPPPPGAYYPPAPPAAPPAASGASAPGPIAYTQKPAWTDAQGRQCREYKTTQMVNGRPNDVYGTACQEPNGQWVVVQ